MNRHDEPLAHLLARLPQAQPDARRTKRVQAKCQALLARRTRPPAHRPAHPIESLCIVGLCVAYLISVIQYALQ